MSKLDEIVQQIGFDEFQYPRGLTDETGKQQIKDLIIELTDPFYTESFNQYERNATSQKRYEDWVDFRQKVKAL